MNKRTSVYVIDTIDTTRLSDLTQILTQPVAEILDALEEATARLLNILPREGR